MRQTAAQFETQFAHRAKSMLTVVGIMALLAMCGTCAQSVHAGSISALRQARAVTSGETVFVCPVPVVEENTLVAAGFNIILGKYWRSYDSNQDHKIDLQTEYDIKGTREDKTLILSTFPNVYHVHTETRDEVWYDMQGNGRCEDFRQSQDQK